MKNKKKSGNRLQRRAKSGRREAEPEYGSRDGGEGERLRAKKDVVRSHFPETWLFQLNPVDRKGKAVVSLKAPDTLTSWTGEAVCMSSKAGIGLAEPASILVKKVTDSLIRIII